MKTRNSQIVYGGARVLIGILFLISTCAAYAQAPALRLENETGGLGVVGRQPTLQLLSPSTSRAAVATNHVNGAVGESLMDAYFTGQDWKPIKRIGVQGIDGLYVRLGRDGVVRDVLIVESKTGTSQLHDTKTRGFQMSREWILTNLEKLEKKYQNLLTTCSDPQIRKELHEQISRLQQTRKHVLHGNFRLRLFHTRINAGCIEISIKKLDITRGSGRPREVGLEGSVRRIPLGHPETLSGEALQFYNKYFECLEQKLAKRMPGDPGLAEKIVRELKDHFISHPQASSKETHAFLSKAILDYLDGQQTERVVVQGAEETAALTERHLANVIRTLRQTQEVQVVTETISHARGFGILRTMTSRVPVAADLALNACFTYTDVQRWKFGEISTDQLVFKVILRSVQSGLVLYPGLGSKIAAGGLLVVDLVTDPLLEGYMTRKRELFTRIDRDARFETCRTELLRAAQPALVPAP